MSAETRHVKRRSIATSMALTSHLRAALAVTSLSTVSLFLYTADSSLSPGPLGAAEAALAEQAQSVASTGRDLRGRLLPLYVQVGDTEWLQPVPVYFTALLVKVLPASEFTVRRAVAVVGTIDVALMWLIARRIFRRQLAGLAAAAMVMLAPSHFIYSRVGLDYLYPVPFVLGWALCLHAFVERPRRWLLMVAAMCLGVGVYSHSTALILMPLLLLVIAFVLLVEGHRLPRCYGAALLGFAVPLVPIVVWLLIYPETYPDTVGRWAVHLAHVRNPLDGLKAFFNWNTLTNRVSAVWALSSPVLVFVVGSSAIGITRSAGMLLAPVAVFFAVGVRHVVISRSSTFGRALLLGVVSTVLAAASFGEPQAVGREVALVALVVVIASFGVDTLLSAPTRWRRIVAVCLLALMPVQFGCFYRDYVAKPSPALAFVAHCRACNGDSESGLQVLLGISAIRCR